MTFRYEFRLTVINHPYRQRRNPYSKKLEPMAMDARGVWDRETKEWVIKPRQARDLKHAEVRVLNGLPVLTTNKVIGALRKANHRIGKYHRSGQVRGWGHWSSGATTSQDDYGRIMVSEAPSGNFDKRTPEQLREVLAKYAETLKAAGIEVQMNEDGRFFYC